MFERDGRPADYFPTPWPNENAARARYNGVPPDMSVLAKARSYERGFPWFIFDMFTQFQEHGVDYIHALMTGYKEKPPAGFTLPQGSFYNEYFPGHAIAMPPPLSDKRIDYTDGSPTTVDQYLQGRRRVHDVGRRAAHGGAQAHRLPGDDLPDRAGRPALLHQEEGLGRRALAPGRPFGKGPHSLESLRPFAFPG